MILGSLATAVAALSVAIAPAPTFTRSFLSAVAPVDAGWRSRELMVERHRVATAFEEMKDGALEYLGRPYVTGGVGSPGFDCSGLVCRIYAEAGYALPRVSRDQARVGREIPLDRVVPGDILVFVKRKGSSRINHVGIYLGNDEMLHASTGQGRVVVSALSADWYRDRLVGARRILPDPGHALTATSTQLLATVTELEEHDGQSALPPMLRLPADLPAPATGPTLLDLDATSIGVRVAGVTERGRAGLVIAPEATLLVEDWALEVTLAAPIRLDPDVGATVGSFEDARDVLKFVRGVALGLPNADLELRLTRFGDLSLARGVIVDRFQPAAAVQGIAGLAVSRTPLSLFGAYRGRDLALELAIDDVGTPGVFGGSAYTTLIAGWLRGGAALVTDQRAERAVDQRRSITAAEAGVILDAVATPAWTVEVAALGALEQASGDTGWAGTMRLDAEYRFARGGTEALSLRFEGARAGSRFLEAPFSATYAVSRGETYRSIEGALDRFTLGGELQLRLGRFVLSGGHHDAVGEGGQAFDRRSFGLAELRDLDLFGTTLVDLRVSWATRGILTDEAVDVVHGGLRVRFETWLFAEAYLARAEGFEGGVGLTAALLP